MLDRLFPSSWCGLIGTAILSYCVYVLIRKLTQNLPPGPWGLPLLGYAPFMRDRPYRVFWELSKRYGDVVSINAFGTTLVTLNSYSAIKECYSTKGDEFSGRVVNLKSFFGYVTGGLGFLQEEGPTWREHRRFALHTLRDFGFGKLSLEGRVQEIGTNLINGLSATQGKPYDPVNLLANSAFNVILYLTTDKHFQPEDPDFRMLRRNVRTALTTLTGINIFTATPWAKLFPLEWQPDYPMFKKVKEDFHQLSGKFVKEHEETFDENNLRDFIDVFLAEKYKAEKEGKQDSTFIVERLKIILLNLLLAGSETTSNTLNWCLRLISSKPEIQVKLQEELDQVVGRERLPSILDRPNLPYTEAFILEIFRFTTIAPIGIPHSNPEAATLKGYYIPKRSVILSNLWAVHNDPEFWKDPETFDPDRFLDPETKTKRRERVIPFGLGKRSCLGESLARMEVFLFLTMMVQKFTFSLQKEDTGEFKERKSFVRVLEPYQICAHLRD